MFIFNALMSNLVNLFAFVSSLRGDTDKPNTLFTFVCVSIVVLCFLELSFLIFDCLLFFFNLLQGVCVFVFYVYFLQQKSACHDSGSARDFLFKGDWSFHYTHVFTENEEIL